MERSRDDRSLGELFSDLSRQTSTLVRQEVQLAKTEMTDKATKVGKDVASMAAGGAVAYAGFLAIIAAIIILFAEVIPLWLSAFLVGVAVTTAGYLLIQRGREAMKQEGLAPTQTIETLKEDAEWAKRQTQ
jgi:hypothetical protein